MLLQCSSCSSSCCDVSFLYGSAVRSRGSCGIQQLLLRCSSSNSCPCAVWRWRSGETERGKP